MSIANSNTEKPAVRVDARVMRRVRPFENFDVPREIAVCPECGEDLYVDPYEYCVDDGTMDQAGVYVICVMDMDGVKEQEGQWPHRCYQTDWQAVINEVERWMQRCVRVDSAA